MRKVTVAAIQMACSPDAAENRRTAEAMVRQAAGNGAQIILLPELFETPYFCQERRYASYELATTPFTTSSPNGLKPSHSFLVWVDESQISLS